MQALPNAAAAAAAGGTATAPHAHRKEGGRGRQRARRAVRWTVDPTRLPRAREREISNDTRPRACARAALHPRTRSIGHKALCPAPPRSKRV